MQHKKGESQIKKEFDEFAERIMELESFRREVNSLDVRGFETEAGIIKSQLKDVNAIPKIRRELRALENKIRHKRARKVIACKGTKDLLLKSKSIEEDQKLMKSRIKNLRGEIEQTKKKAIAAKELTSKDKVALKKLPELRKEIMALKKDFVEHSKASEVEIDSGVGMIVDDKLEDFLNEIKAKLSERVKTKEAEVGEELKEDLAAHESLFVKRYQEIVNKFNEMYKQRVHDELKKEVRERFKHKLEAKLANERRALVSQLMRENARKLNSEHKKMVEGLHAHYASKEKRLDEDTRKILQDIKSEYHAKENSIEERAKALAEKKRKLSIELGKTSRKENELDRAMVIEARRNKRLEHLLKAKAAVEKEIIQKGRSMEKQMHEKEVAMEKDLHEKEKRAEEKKSRFIELSKAEREAIENLKSQKEALVNEFAKRFEELKERVREDARKKLSEMRKEDRESMDEELEKKERIMRAELDREYNEKMKQEIRIREAEMEKKKAELEKHVMDEARRMFARS